MYVNDPYVYVIRLKYQLGTFHENVVYAHEGEKVAVSAA